MQLWVKPIRPRTDYKLRLRAGEYVLSVLNHNPKVMPSPQAPPPTPSYWPPTSASAASGNEFQALLPCRPAPLPVTACQGMNHMS